MTNFMTLGVAAILTILGMFSGQAFCASEANVPQDKAYKPLGHPTDEPIGGQPPTGAACMIQDFGYQLKYQRAFESALWAIPAVVIYRMRDWAFDELGAQDNTIFAYSKTAGPNLEVATSNSSTSYIGGYTNLQKGPVVLEVPASGPDGTLYGQVVDACFVESGWADIGNGERE